MYNYIVKFTYKGKEYESSFEASQVFDKNMLDEFLAKQASIAANSFIDSHNLREPNIYIGELSLYGTDGKLIWKKK